MFTTPRLLRNGLFIVLVAVTTSCIASAQATASQKTAPAKLAASDMSVIRDAANSGDWKKIKAILAPMIPEFSVGMGGASSIDVTRPGVDKAYGIHKLEEVLGVPIKEMIFVGDALFPGGNDEPARKTGVACIKVRDPEETRRVIEAVIACVGG